MRGGFVRLSVLVMALAIGVAGSPGAWSIAAARPALQATGAPALDLAALTIQPGDLDEPGWVHEGAFFEQLAGEAAGYAAYLGGGGPVEPVVEAMTAMGWQQKYIHSIALPDPQRPGAPPQRIRSYVTEYATPEGAADGFAFFEDEGSIEAAEDIETSRTFGDASELTQESGVSGIDGRRFRSVDLTFRSGALVAGVTLVIYENAILTAPTGDIIESLAGIIEARIATGSGPSAGLSPMVARLAPPEPAVVTYDDAYYRIEGRDVPLAGESTMEATRRADTYADAIDVYQLWQGVNAGAPTGVMYGVTMLRFPSDQAAASWVTDLETILAANPFYRAFQPVEVTTALGDQTNALSYIAGGDATTPRSVLVAVRIGSLVARVHVVPQGRASDVPANAVIALAAAQAACLSGNSCATISALPDGLLIAPALPGPAASPSAGTLESA